MPSKITLMEEQIFCLKKHFVSVGTFAKDKQILVWIGTLIEICQNDTAVEKVVAIVGLLVVTTKNHY